MFTYPYYILHTDRPFTQRQRYIYFHRINSYIIVHGGIFSDVLLGRSGALLAPLFGLGAFIHLLTTYFGVLVWHNGGIGWNNNIWYQEYSAYIWWLESTALLSRRAAKMKRQKIGRRYKYIITLWWRVLWNCVTKKQFFGFIPQIYICIFDPFMYLV